MYGPPDPNNPIWVDGWLNKIPLREVKDSHLQNIERFLIGRGYKSHVPIREQLFVWWYDTIRDEMDRRNLPILMDDHETLVAYKEHS